MNNVHGLPGLRLVPLLLLVLFSSGCGSTEPENRLTIRGVVVAASDGGGASAGEALADVEVTFRYVEPLSLASTILDFVVTPADGSWQVTTSPPAGRDESDCSTLSISARKGGFHTRTLPVRDLCDGPTSGVIEDVRIELEPIT